MTRRQARETALQMIFQVDLGQNEPAMVANTLAESGLSKQDQIFAAELCDGVAVNLAALDALIAAEAKDWTVERLFSVDRNILRLALFETLYGPKTPASVVIDEAVELAKVFGTDESYAFVNAFLDKIIKVQQSSVIE